MIESVFHFLKIHREVIFLSLKLWFKYTPFHRFCKSFRSGQKVEGGFRGRETFCPRASARLRLPVRAKRRNKFFSFLNWKNGGCV